MVYPCEICHNVQKTDVFTLHFVTKNRLKDHISLPCTQSENRRGDFYDQVVQDKKETNITFNKKDF